MDTIKETYDSDDELEDEKLATENLSNEELKVCFTVCIGSLHSHAVQTLYRDFSHCL